MSVSRRTYPVTPAALALAACWAAIPANVEAQRSTVSGARSPVAAPAVDRVTCSRQSCPTPLSLSQDQDVPVEFFGSALSSVSGARLESASGGVSVDMRVGDAARDGSRVLLRLKSTVNPSQPTSAPVEGRLQLTTESGQTIDTPLTVSMPGTRRLHFAQLFVQPMSGVLRTGRLSFGSCGPLSSNWKIRVQVAGYATEEDIPRIPGSQADGCIEERSAAGNWTVTGIEGRSGGLHVVIEVPFSSVDFRYPGGNTYTYSRARFLALVPFQVTNGIIALQSPIHEWTAAQGQWNRSWTNSSGAVEDWIRQRMDDIAAELSAGVRASRVQLQRALRDGLKAQGINNVLKIRAFDADEWSVVFTN